VKPLVSALLLAGCAAELDPSSARLLEEVVSAPGDTGAGFRDVGRAVNGVRGGGWTAGSLDVFTVTSELVLGTDGVPVLDGPGPELVVFENPFVIGSGGVFVEPAVVEVSADCEAFAAFPHTYHGGDQFLREPAAWDGFAGLTPVALHAEERPLDPLSAEAGGDAFDLGDLDPGDAAAEDVLANGFLCVRITPATAWTSPATGAPYPEDPVANGPDIDGVWVR
jgi:hypothetical protein